MAKLPAEGAWSGPTYYGRAQLKAAPFNTWVVGGYVALAGLAGKAALIGAIADMVEGRPAERTVRHARYLSLLAPTIGAGLLVWDLHTPKRFYNMFRVAKATSPMSIGTWMLTVFGLATAVTGAAQVAGDRRPGAHRLRAVARVAQVPAALAGAGMGTYTAALLAATSTPLWAAAPRAMAVRFAASSMAASAAALSLLERAPGRRSRLDALTLAALSTSLAAGSACHRAYRARGVDGALDSAPGRTERLGATVLGAAVPAALQAAALGLNQGSRVVSPIANLLVLGGSLLLRVSMMQAGNVSANRPEVSFRFSQPENLPKS